MRKLLSTTDSLGAYDFISNLIELKHYTAGAKKFIEEALRDPLPTSWSDAWPAKVNIRSLVIHELTHFADCTTTLWGLELTYRKFRLMNAISDGHSTNDPLSVFFINISELTSHADLVVVGDRPLSDATSMVHRVEIHKKFGPVIYVDFKCGEAVFHTVPLSMLAVIEANAYANEILVKIKACEELQESQEKTQYARKVERDFEAILADREQSEYTVLLRLSRTHFPTLSLKELLIFVSTLCRFTLDLSDPACSVISNIIERSITNRAGGSTISQDLRRSSSRAVIFFKTVLFLYGWMTHSNYSTRTNIMRLLQAEPKRAISKLWNYLHSSFSLTEDMSELFIFESMLSATINIAKETDKNILECCSRQNRAFINENPLGLCDLDKLQFLGFFLDDGTEIEMPNGPNINISSYLDGRLDIISKVELMCRRELIRKFFLELDGPIQYFPINDPD